MQKNISKAVSRFAAQAVVHPVKNTPYSPYIAILNLLFFSNS